MKFLQLHVLQENLCKRLELTQELRLKQCQWKNSLEMVSINWSSQGPLKYGPQSFARKGIVEI
jgi:hypothetical protein